jgi:Tfp pilus assembly protein PilF
MNRKIIAIIVLGLVLLASLLACGYFGLKTVRRTRLRRAAMEAYEKKDYILAERLLHAYVRQDPNAEAEFVTLANVYHVFGNAEMEAQMWQTASALNPLKQEYHENMLTSAVQSASYDLLHSILGRKAKMGESFTDQELYLYVISSFRSGYRKDGTDTYTKAVENNPEAFHKSDLGRMAEFMVKYSELSEAERNNFLNQAMQSEDPVIRFEAIYTVINRTAQDGNDEADDEQMTELLKHAMETNYFVGAPLLADYYFSKTRFGEAISVAEPYLKTIDDLSMYLLYAESCVFKGKLDELKELEKKLRTKSGYLPFLADYCSILIAYLENDEDKIVAAVRKSGKLVNSPLSRFIRLRVALATDVFSEIRAIAQEIFPAAPFYDLHNRASIVCLDYISGEMKKKENQKDPSQIAELAKILSSYLVGNRLLTEIILMDQYKKGIAKEADLLSAMEMFPDDALLMRLTAEYLIFNGKPEQALSIIEHILSSTDETIEEPDRGILFLFMLALDQVGRHEEAANVFQKLVEQSEFDLDILGQYFHYCVKNKQKDNLTSMADRLDAVQDGKLEHFGKFFRAAALLLTEKEAEQNEALDILASTPTGSPEFTFYAANRLCENDRLDEAEAKYKAILKTYRTPSLIHVNLSIIYHAKGDKQKSLEEAKEAFDLEKGSASMLSAFIYAKRLSEAKRYEEAVNILNFPHRAVNYREDVVELWVECMHHVIENSIAGERYMQAEEQCKHLLTISPDDEFGKENLEEVRELIKQQNDKGHPEQTAPAA